MSTHTILKFDVVIVGGGHAGANAAIRLRTAGYSGSVAILTDEELLPYQRPPLSKDYLKGGVEFDRLLIRPASFWALHSIDIRTGSKVVELNPSSKTVTCSDGKEIVYGTLVWAAGGEPKTLSALGASGAAVDVIRRRADIDRLRRRLRPAGRVVIIGGGYIGLESAAAMADLQQSVVLLETQARVLGRVAGETLARFLENKHRERGVTLHTNATISNVQQQADGRHLVTVSSGADFVADSIIAGVGIDPNVKVLQDAGANCENGIVIDGCCRTSLPFVYAIGDCTVQTNPYTHGTHMRIESVQNANYHAGVVASHIIGGRMEEAGIPWFWSDQYNLKIQSVGLKVASDREDVMGDQSTERFSVWHYRADQLIAVEAVNDPAQFVRGKKRILEEMAR